MRRPVILHYCIVMLCFLYVFGVAQEQGDPLYDDYIKNFKKEYFNLTTILQFVFDYQNERTLPGYNGFSVGNMRLQIKGRFDHGFGYFFQTNFATTPAILDADMYYQFSPELTLKIGQFKTPFSYEFLVPVYELDFFNRARIVDLLAPGRDVGLQISGKVFQNSGSYSLGAFNGSGSKSNANTNNNFLYAGRIALFPFSFAEGANGDYFEIGLNGAYSKDNDVNIAGGFLPGFAGKRWLFGGDFRWTHNGFMLSGEYISAELNSFSNSNMLKPSGFHISAGYYVLPEVQALIRWDQMDYDRLDENNKNSDWIILGVNYFPTRLVCLQVNDVIDTEQSEMKYHQILFNAQIVF